MKKQIKPVLLTLMILCLMQGCVRPKDTVQTKEETATATPVATPEETPLDPSLFTDTDSILIIANKKHKLPDGYVPSDLVTPDIPSTLECTMKKEAAEALKEMAQAAKGDGVTLTISSAYRSEEYQASLYNYYAGLYGSERADTISARPGYSEHQTGLAADFVEGDGSMDGINFNESFENTDSALWLKEHAQEYGFILRYPKGKEDITGFSYEPWHFRYVGVEYAEKIKNAGTSITMEEYFHIEGGDYES